MNIESEGKRLKLSTILECLDDIVHYYLVTTTRRSAIDYAERRYTILQKLNGVCKNDIDNSNNNEGRYKEVSIDNETNNDNENRLCIEIE